MSNDAVLVELLKTLASGRAFSNDVEIPQESLRVFVSAGLGPLLCSALDKAGLLECRDPSQQLRAAAMTSRVMTRELIDNVCVVVELLQASGVPVAVLKGVSFATRHYGEPHLRLMGDLDLLLIDGSTTKAEQVLVANGFQPDAPSQKIDYDRHIHSAPLFSSQRHLWVEPHRRLIPNHFAASRETPLNLQQVEQHLETITLGGCKVSAPTPEFELVYLATGWFRDLAYGFESARSQRGLVDLVVLLQSAGAQLDWDTVLRWSNRTQIGACLYLMLSFIQRIGVYQDSDGICQQLRQRQHQVNPLVAAIIHDRLEQHVLTFGEFGRLLRASVNQQLVCSLIRKRPAWRNLLSVPWDLLFPTNRADRYDLRRLVRRVSKLGRA